MRESSRALVHGNWFVFTSSGERKFSKAVISLKYVFSINFPPFPDSKFSPNSS